jgi:pimeloyl-ACP methyl ester carboxylesterase
MLPSAMPGWERAIAGFTRSGGYYRLGDRLAILQPTLILWSEQDDMVGTDAAYRFERAIANSQLVWLAGAAHVPQWERPGVVAKAILDFINA